MLPAPDRLENLLDETEEGIRDTCVQYNRGTDPDRFRVSRSVIKKLISLMHWVKDKNQVQERIEFPTGTSQSEELMETSVRDRYRKSQKKTGETFVTKKIALKLKNASQWEWWKVELNSTLNSIIGAKGVPLSYIIREEDGAVINKINSSWD